MGKYLAAFYSLNDDLEHALSPIPPINPPPGLPAYAGEYAVQDYTFSLETQGKLFYVGPLPHDRAIAITGTYSPVDRLRYFFFANAEENIVYGSWYTGNYKDPIDPQLLPNGYFPLNDPLVGYPNGSIVDIAAFFTPEDNQVHVVVLLNDGAIYQGFGTSSIGTAWTFFPFFIAPIKDARSLCAYYSAQDQSSHAMIATFQDIIELRFTRHSTELTPFFHFDGGIIDSISGFYTPDDSFQHVIVTNERQVNEITRGPGAQSPSIRTLGTVSFDLGDIGAYVKPDGGRHVIMIGKNTDAYQLYLSWYYPGWSDFAYSLWPPITAPSTT